MGELTVAFLEFLVDLTAANADGGIRTRRDAKRAWEQLEAVLKERFAWLGLGEIHGLTRDPEVQRELQSARHDRRRPNAALLERVLTRVLQDAQIDLRDRSVVDVIHRFGEEYYARFSGDLTAVVVGSGIGVQQSLDLIVARLNGLSSSMRTDSGESLLVEMQRTALQKGIATQLDLVKAHLDKREFLNALTILERLPEENDVLGWTDDLRYYRRARLGCCLLAMGRDTEALEHFSSALSFRPGNPAARNNLLVARHACGEPAEDLLCAVNSILRDDPSFADGFCTKASLLLTLDRPQEAVDLLDDHGSLPGDTRAACHQILARACQAAGNHKRADELARACLKKSPESAEAHELLGVVLLRAGRRPRDEASLGGAPAAEVKVDLPALEEAAGAFKTAAGLFRANYGHARATPCLLNGAVCLRELGDFAGARQHYQQVTAGSPTQPMLLEAIRGVAALDMYEGSFDSASRSLAWALEIDPTDLITAFNLCVAFANSERWEDAERQVSALLSRPELPAALRLDAEVLKAEVIWRAGRRDESQAMLAELRHTHPSAWQPLVPQAQQACLLDQRDLAQESIRTALSLAPCNLVVLQVAAQVFRENSSFEEAADALVRLIGCSRDLGRRNAAEIYRNAVVALCAAGREDEALRILDDAEAEGIDGRELLETRAQVHMAALDYRQAKPCWLELLTADPDNPRLLRGLAQAESGLFELTEALRHLRRVAEIGEADPRLCLYISQLCSDTESRPEAAHWAERAVAEGASEEADLHHAAICLALDAGRTDLAVPWMEQFHARWPEDSRMYSVHGDTAEDSVSQLQELIRPFRGRCDYVLAGYRARAFPLSCLARNTNRPLADLWDLITRDEELGLEIRCHSEGRADQINQVACAMEADRITVDPVALLTLDLLGHLPLLCRMFRELLVPEGLLEALRLDRARARGDVVRSRLDRILGFISRDPSVKRVPLQAPSALDSRDTVIWKVLGPLGSLPVAAAGRCRVPLFADDLGLQALARQHGCESFGTVGLLDAALRKGLIDQEDHSRSVRVMVGSRYSYVPINAKVLVAAIRAEPMEGDAAVRRMLAGMLRPEADRASYAYVFGESLGEMWLRWPAGCEEDRIQWTYRILDQASAAGADALWTQACVSTCIRCILASSGDAADFAGCAYQWSRSKKVGQDLLAAAIASAARDQAGGVEMAQALADQITAPCPKALQKRVRRIVRSSAM